MAVVVPYLIMTVISVAVGFAMTAMQKKPNIQGAKLGDIATQTAKEGGARLIVWGIVRPIGGNVVACSDPIAVSTTTSSGGKGGGGGASQTTESVYRTYAIGICEGPVTGVRRVWRNNKLVYDGRDGASAETIANNNVFLQKARFYLGSFTQMPDPNLEGIFGVGNVPAMRGTCYMVINYENLTELGGALPQFIFEVGNSEQAVTTKPYPLENTDSLQSASMSIDGGYLREILKYYNNYPPESVSSVSFSLVSGELREVIKIYSIEESLQCGSMSVISGELRDILKTYEDGEIESIEGTSMEISSGVLRVALLKYEYGEVESLQCASMSITGGYLGT